MKPTTWILITYHQMTNQMAAWLENVAQAIEDSNTICEHGRTPATCDRCKWQREYERVMSADQEQRP